MINRSHIISRPFRGQNVYHLTRNLFGYVNIIIAKKTIRLKLRFNINPKVKNPAVVLAADKQIDCSVFLLHTLFFTILGGF